MCYEGGLGSVVLSDRATLQEAVCVRRPEGPVHGGRARPKVAGAEGRRGRGVTADASIGGDKSILELPWRRPHNTANVLKATKLYSVKWLRWQILCYMNFNIRETWRKIISCIFMSLEFQTRH